MLTFLLLQVAAPVGQPGSRRSPRARGRGARLAHGHDPAGGGRRGPDRRPAGRAGLGPGDPADRVLAVSAGGRPPGRRGDRGAGLVRARRDPLRHHRARPLARLHPRDRRRPRQHRQRRSHRPRHRHLPRPPAGVLLRGESAGIAERRGAERGRGPGVQPDPGGHRSQSRLHLGVEGPDHRPGLRGRDPDPLQEPALPLERRAGLGLQRHPRGQAHRLHRHLDRRAAGQRQLPGTGRRDRRPHRPPSWGDHGGAAVRHRHRQRLSRHRHRRVRPGRGESRRRAQLPARLHQLRARRHHQPRFQPGGERCRPGDGERAVRPLLPREAAVLPRGDRALRHAPDAGLHPADRGPQGRSQVHRQVRPARRGPPDRARRVGAGRRAVQHHPAPERLRSQLDRGRSPSPTAT